MTKKTSRDERISSRHSRSDAATPGRGTRAAAPSYGIDYIDLVGGGAKAPPGAGVGELDIFPLAQVVPSPAERLEAFLDPNLPGPGPSELERILSALPFELGRSHEHGVPPTRAALSLQREDQINRAISGTRTFSISLTNEQIVDAAKLATTWAERLRAEGVAIARESGAPRTVVRSLRQLAPPMALRQRIESVLRILYMVTHPNETIEGWLDSLQDSLTPAGGGSVGGPRLDARATSARERSEPLADTGEVRRGEPDEPDPVWERGVQELAEFEARARAVNEGGACEDYLDREGVELTLLALVSSGSWERSWVFEMRDLALTEEQSRGWWELAGPLIESLESLAPSADDHIVEGGGSSRG